MNKKKILLTGSSGFLGSHILDYLNKKNYHIITLGRSIKSDINIDLSQKKLSKIDVDYVIHVAGKAHSIPKSKKENDEFYKVNFDGTKNLLFGLNTSKLKSIIFISTVAVYGKETGKLIDENSQLNGNTPYARSKILAEKFIINFGIKNDLKTVILRLPLVTGKNPVGNLRSMIQAIRKGYYFRVGNGKAKKSIISAFDIANLIPELFDLNGVYNLTDTKHPSISEIDTIIASKLNKKIISIPTYLIKIIARIGDSFSFFPFNTMKYNKLTRSLTFSNKKILNDIKYIPSKGLSEIIRNLNN